MTFLYRHSATQVHGQLLAWNAASSQILESLPYTVTLYPPPCSHLLNSSFAAVANLSLFLFIVHFLTYEVQENHSGEEFKMWTCESPSLPFQVSHFNEHTDGSGTFSQDALWETLVWVRSKQVRSPLGTTM